MFSFFRKKKADATPAATGTLQAEPSAPDEGAAPAAREPWLARLRAGLRRTGSGIAQVFTGTRIDDALYEELESALLMADVGVGATQHLLSDLRRRVKETRTTEPAAVKVFVSPGAIATRRGRSCVPGTSAPSPTVTTCESGS